MTEETDFGYGVIPYIQTPHGVKFFLIHQYGYKGDIFWTFPKGHAEGEETPTEAALRELSEETHLALEKLYEDKYYVQEYEFTTHQSRVHKIVQYYLGRAQSEHFEIQKDEVESAGWFSASEARERLTHDIAKQLFDEVLQDLDNTLV